MIAARVLELMRRRDAERARVERFVAAIRATAAPAPLRPMPVPLPRVEAVITPRGTVWRLDNASRARLRDTAELPRVIARASAPLR